MTEASDMTIEREIAVIHARQDEQGRLINQQGERLNIQSTRIDGLMLIVLGDDEKQIKGLLQRTGEHEKLLGEMERWRHDLMIYARAGIAVLGFTSLGTWLPYIQQFFRLIGG